MLKRNILVVGFPKSGTTWLSRLVAELLQCPLQGDWAYETDDPLYKDGSERISEFQCYKSHHTFDQIRKVSELPINTIIYIIRDPRDIVISGVHYFYFWFPFLRFLKSRALRDIVNKTLPIKEKKRQMIHAVLFGDQRINSWFKTSWDNHYKGYLREKILFIRYEDLIDTPETECAKIVDHLNIEASAEHIRKSIERHVFQKRKKEVLKEDNKILKKLIRKGAHGYWKEELTAKEILLFKKSLKNSDMYNF